MGASRSNRIGGPGSPRPTYKNSKQKHRQALRQDFELTLPPGTTVGWINDILEDIGLKLGQVWIEDCLTTHGVGVRITIPEAHRGDLRREATNAD